MALVNKQKQIKKIFHPILKWIFQSVLNEITCLPRIQMSRIQGGNEVIKKEAMTKHFTAM